MAPVKRRKIDDELRLELFLRIPEHVGEHETSLGIGIDDFDRLTRHRLDDVARTNCVAGRHILDAADQADGVDVCLALGEGVHGTDDGSCSAHIALHVLHAGRRLDRNAAGIEDHALTDEADRLLLLAALGAVPDHDREAGRPDASLTNAEKRAHAELFHVFDVEDLDLDAKLLEGFRFLRQLDRPQNIGRLVDEIASHVDAVCDGLQRMKCGLRFVGMRHMDNELLQAVFLWTCVLARFLRQVFFEVVVAQKRALSHQRADLI